MHQLLRNRGCCRQLSLSRRDPEAGTSPKVAHYLLPRRAAFGKRRDKAACSPKYFLDGESQSIICIDYMYLMVFQY